MNVPDLDGKRGVVFSLLAALIVLSAALPAYHFLVRPNVCQYEEVHPGFEVSTTYDESNETLAFTHIGGGELNGSNTDELAVEVLAREGGDLVVVHREPLSTADALPFRPGERLVVPADERWAERNYGIRFEHVRDPFLPWYCWNREPRESSLGRETI